MRRRITRARDAEQWVFRPWPRRATGCQGVGVNVPTPRDEYAVVIDMVKLDINKGVKDDQFVLDEGFAVVGHRPGHGQAREAQGKLFVGRETL